MPQDHLEEKVLRVIERDVLTPSRVERALKRADAMAKARLKSDPATRRRLQTELKRLENERDNLTALSAQKLDDPTAVARALNERVRQIKTIEADLSNLEDQFDETRLADVRLRMAADIARFRDMMIDRRNAALARQVLRRLLVEPIRCIPIVRDGRRDYAIRGVATTGAFLSGIWTKTAANRWRPHGDSNPGYRRESAPPPPLAFASFLFRHRDIR